MARIAGVNIPNHQHARIALTAIYGIGRTRAAKICVDAGVNPTAKMKDLSDAEMDKLREQVGKYTVEGDLRRALSRGEFEPHFQAIVRLEDAAVVGYEALLRWRHSERGLLLPGEFLNVAEDNGSIEQIDWQMFALFRFLTGLGIGGEFAAGAALIAEVFPQHARATALSVSFTFRRSLLRAARSRKCAASTGTSSRRALSGGISSGTTLRRS